MTVEMVRDWLSVARTTQEPKALLALRSLPKEEQVKALVKCAGELNDCQQQIIAYLSHLSNEQDL